MAQVRQQPPLPMPFVESTSDAVSRGASSDAEYRLSESADAAFVENYGVENSFGTAAYDMVTTFSQAVVNARTIDGIPDGELKDRQVSTALNKMRRDVISLDTLASSRSQLTSVELLVLTSTVLISAATALSKGRSALALPESCRRPTASGAARLRQ